MALKTGRDVSISQPKHEQAFPHLSLLPLTVPDPPFSLRWESLGLIVAGGRGDNLITMLVDSASLCCSQLWLFLGLLLNFSYLLPLLWRCRDLHTQDDVSNFWLCQWCHIHTVGTCGSHHKDPFLLSHLCLNNKSVTWWDRAAHILMPDNLQVTLVKKLWSRDVLIRFTTSQNGLTNVHLSAILKPAQHPSSHFFLIKSALE